MDEVETFIGAMRRTYQGRPMAERVFRQLTGAHPGHSACLTDDDLAAYLTGQGWSMADVVRRES